MNNVLLFALLGLGAGAAYAITALGLVAIYKGSGIINFAQGAIAMFTAFCCTELTSQGMPVGFAAALSILGAGIGGSLLYLSIFRPLRQAQPLAQLVVTIGLLITLDGIAFTLWGSGSSAMYAVEVLPSAPFQVGDVAVGSDRLWLLAIVIALGSGLWALYRFTGFGIATRAAAENERSATLLGHSPDVLGCVNWAIGCACAGLAGVLLAPIAALDITVLTFIIVPVLAAALVGRFTSFGIICVASILIGIAQSEVTLYWNGHGAATALPFIIVVIIMIITGRVVPRRGGRPQGKQPFSADARIRIPLAIIFPLVTIVALVFATGAYQQAIITSLIFTVICLSLVVLTGYLGQVSLAQMTFAGFGAFIASRLALDLQLPMLIVLLIAALASAVCGVVIGLPALKVRGIGLAIVTLGVAVATDAMLFQRSEVTGGGKGSHAPPPHLFGIDISAQQHPVAFGVFTFCVLALLMVGVSRLRRSHLGRRMLAVRTNERAAVANGINVSAVKLQGFGISAFIAGVGGVLLLYQAQVVTYAQFVPMQSIVLIAVAYVGGIACVSGALQAGVLVSGGLLYVAVSGLGPVNEYWAWLTGLALTATIVLQPDGVVAHPIRVLGRRFPGRRPDDDASSAQSERHPRDQSDGAGTPSALVAGGKPAADRTPTSHHEIPQ